VTTQHAREKPEFIPTRSSLLSRLKHWDDHESWRDFFDTYWKLIYNTAVKSGLSEAEAQDVVQDTVLSVAKKMRDFKYDPALGSFKGWLLQLTGWRIKDRFKKRMPGGLHISSDGTSTQTAAIENVADPASADLTAFWDAQWQQNLIDVAVERVKQQASPRQYEIFYLQVIKKQPVGVVAQTLKVNAAQVYLAKHRVSALVKREVKRLEKEMV